MANDKSCLKRLCIAFNVIYGILGSITLAIGIIGISFNDSVEFDKGGQYSAITLCVSGSIVMLVALLGSYGSYKEKRWALIVYTSFLCLQTIGIAKDLFTLASFQPEVNVENKIESLRPLDQANPDIQKAMKKLQTVAECCGLIGYQDWRDSIPQSCHCPSDYGDRSKCQLVKTRMYSFDQFSTGSKVEVYKKPCGPIILKYVKMGHNFVVGLVCAFATVVVLSIVLSWLLKNDIRDQTTVTPVTSWDGLKLPAYEHLKETHANV